MKHHSRCVGRAGRATPPVQAVPTQQQTRTPMHCTHCHTYQRTSLVSANRMTSGTSDGVLVITNTGCCRRDGNTTEKESEALSSHFQKLANDHSHESRNASNSWPIMQHTHVPTYITHSRAKQHSQSRNPSLLQFPHTLADGQSNGGIGNETGVTPSGHAEKELDATVQQHHSVSIRRRALQQSVDDDDSEAHSHMMDHARTGAIES